MFYYSASAVQTSNGTANTENMSARALTVANQRTAAITGLTVGGRMAAAGGLLLRLKTMGTAGTAGTGYTPDKRDPDGPVAATTIFTAHTVGATPTTRVIVGAAAPGGFGGWFAAALEQALTLKPNGGANGNAELTNISALISTVFEWILEFAEL